MKGKRQTNKQERYCPLCPLHKKKAAAASSSLSKLEEEVTAEPVLTVFKLSSDAIIPTKGSKNAAGYDLYSPYDCVVHFKDKLVVNTNLQISLPIGCYGRVAPRSGLAAKHYIDIGAGVIDADYRGNVGVVIFNHSYMDFKIKRGDRIAQLICERNYLPELRVVESKDKLNYIDGDSATSDDDDDVSTDKDKNKRGEKGFGSTGR